MNFFIIMAEIWARALVLSWLYCDGGIEDDMKNHTCYNYTKDRQLNESWNINETLLSWNSNFSLKSSDSRGPANIISVTLGMQCWTRLIVHFHKRAVWPSGSTLDTQPLVAGSILHWANVGRMFHLSSHCLAVLSSLLTTSTVVETHRYLVPLLQIQDFHTGSSRWVYPLSYNIGTLLRILGISGDGWLYDKGGRGLYYWEVALCNSVIISL